MGLQTQAVQCLCVAPHNKGVGDMTLDHVPFIDRAFGAAAFALLLLAAPLTAVIFLAQTL